MLVESNKKFVESCFTFQEGGDYDEREIEISRRSLGEFFWLFFLRTPSFLFLLSGVPSFNQAFSVLMDTSHALFVPLLSQSR